MGLGRLEGEMLKKLKVLYVLNQRKYIVQTIRGSYKHENRKLDDLELFYHLKRVKTVGIFSGDVYTKFICFDVDYKEISEAKKVTRLIVNVLEEEFGLSRKDILVSFSGSKGYHVEVFFDDVMYVSDAKRMYDYILRLIGVSREDVEFRPTGGQAVKMPLSINTKSGVKCYLVDSCTFKPVKDERLLEVTKVDKDKLVDSLLYKIKGLKNIEVDLDYVTEDLGEEEVKRVDSVFREINLDEHVDYVNRCKEMLSENSLLYTGSRNISTVLLISYLTQTGYKREETINIVSKVIENTYRENRELISKDTKLDFALSEVRRLYKYASGYRLTNGKKSEEVKVYKGEVSKIMGVKKINLKRLLFILLVHSKRHAEDSGEFYMTYKQMTEYGAAKDRKTLSKGIEELSELGLVEIVQRGKRVGNRVKNESNIYKVNIVSREEEEYITINKKEAVKFETVVVSILDRLEVKKAVTKRQYESTFKKLYA